MTAELFSHSPRHVSLPLQEERELIIMAKAGGQGAQWELLLQYAGILQRTAYDVQARVQKMTPEQVEDMQGALVLAALEAIQAFDMDRFVRLSQVLPGRLRDVALEMTTALAIPRGTLALWFKVWRAAGQDFDGGARIAPGLGMSTNTFRAIAHALEYAGSEWVTVPHDGALAPTADTETYRVAHLALGFLKPEEREVIELFYGFRGDPKSDQEVADIQGISRTWSKRRRLAGIERMRTGLADAA